METNNLDKSNDETNTKRRKMETRSSTSSKPESKDPFLSLPQDILVKIIGYTAIAQWRTLETLDTNFRDATFIAWRQLRDINVDREFMIKAKNGKAPSAFRKSIGTVLRKLAERSPFLTSLNGISIRLDAELHSDVIESLAKFEHLQSISLGDAKLFSDNERAGIRLEAAVDFLESTQSRGNLKELQLFNVDQCGDQDTILERFASSFAEGREIQSPLKLEKLSLMLQHSLHLRLDNLDTTRLVEVRLGNSWIEPEQLTNLIGRASNLRSIELSFLGCPEDDCNGPRLRENKNLLKALSSHEKLTAISFGFIGDIYDVQCTNFEGDFIEMLQTIGHRGQLRKLALDGSFMALKVAIDMNMVFATIRDCMPCLKSIKSNMERMNDVFGTLTELEEICVRCRVTANAIEKIALLQNLRRLAVDLLPEGNTDSLACMANTMTLTDVRIRFAHLISANVYEKWADGFGANLEVLMLRGLNEHDDRGLGPLLEKAVGLRVLILEGWITDKLLLAIAKSRRPQLKVLGIQPCWKFDVQYLQAVVDRCPNMKKFGGVSEGIRNQLRFPKYRKIGALNMRFWEHDWDDDEYD